MRFLFGVESFDILDLFADLFDLGFDGQKQVCDGSVLGFDAHGGGFSVHLLAEKVKASADHTACFEELEELCEVTLEACDLFGDIGTIGQQSDLLVDALGFDRLCERKGV